MQRVGTGHGRQLVVMAAALVALAAGTTAGWLLHGDGRPPQPERMGAALLLPQREPLPAFRLSGTSGPVTAEGLRGRWSVLFFGYTHCPDVCPATLAVLAAALEALPPQARGGVRALLVSVDPRRDSPARLADYVAYFGAGIEAATGDADQVGRLARAVGAYYALEEPGPDGSYLVNHSASLFLVDPEGRFAGVISPPLEAKSLAETLARLTEGAAS